MKRARLPVLTLKSKLLSLRMPESQSASPALALFSPQGSEDEHASDGSNGARRCGAHEASESVQPSLTIHADAQSLALCNLRCSGLRAPPGRSACIPSKCVSHQWQPRSSGAAPASSGSVCVCGSRLQKSPMNIQRDAICPRKYEIRISQLLSAFPTFRPSCLRRVERGVIRETARHQKAHRKVEATLICLTVFFVCHLLSTAP